MSLTPELLHTLATKLESVYAEVAMELKEALGVLPEPPQSKPVLTRRFVDNCVKNVKAERKAMNMFTGSKKATSATHKINATINLEKFRKLRQSGFCEGMKFAVTCQPRLGKVVVYHPRSGRHANMNPCLLTEIKPNDF